MANLFSNSMILPLLVIATRSAGANTNQALPLILVASMSGSPMMAVVLAATLVRAQKPVPPVAAAVAGAALIPPGVPVNVGPGPAVAFNPGDFLRPFGMVTFHGYDRDHAERLARLLGLDFEIKGDGPIVTSQEPAIGAPWPQNNLLKLMFDGPRSQK